MDLRPHEKVTQWIESARSELESRERRKDALIEIGRKVAEVMWRPGLEHFEGSYWIDCKGTPSLIVVNLQGFDEVVPIVEEFTKEFGKMVAWNDHPSYYWREFLWSDFTLFAQIRTNAARCKRIVVSTKEEIVETKKYKFVCEGDPDFSMPKGEE